MRSVPEWIGKNDDAPFPPRVRLRILDRFNGFCANCGNKIVGTFTADHIIALCNKGQNRESNGQPLCRICTKPKDAADVADKGKVADMRKADHGLKARRASFSKVYRRKMDGVVVYAATGQPVARGSK